MPKDDYPTSIRMNYDLRKYLRMKAKRQGCSVAFMINQIVRESMERDLEAVGGDEARLYDRRLGP